MAVRSGVDFVVAGTGEFAALVNVSDENVTLHCADPRVPGSGNFTLAKGGISETEACRNAMIRFQLKEWCIEAQAKRPHKVKVVTADRGVAIRDKAEAYHKSGVSITDAVRRAYSEVTGKPVTDPVSVHEHREERRSLLTKLKHKRAIDLSDDTLYGHVTNAQLGELLQNPLLLDEYATPQKSEEPLVTKDYSPDEKERRELYQFLRAQGLQVKGFPSLENLKAMHREFESQRMEEAAAAL